MDHIRFTECLAYLFWSQETLADILDCDRFLVRAWAEGGQPIPGTLPPGWKPSLWFTKSPGYHLGTKERKFTKAIRWPAHCPAPQIGTCHTVDTIYGIH